MSSKEGERKLGRGIASLLAMDSDFGIDLDSKNESQDTIRGSLLELNIEDIRANPNQPRKTFDDLKLRELSESIKNNGLLQPIVVSVDKADTSKYLIIAGERRYRATKLAGLNKINAVVLNLEEKEILKNAIIENVQRENLNPIEEANGYKKILEAFGYTHQQLAEAIGKSRAYITNLLRILSLPDNVQSAIKNGNITLGHAKVLLSVDNPEYYLETIIEKQLSVRNLEKWIEKGTLEEEGRKNDKKNNDDASNDGNDDVANITFDMIKQLYSPILQNNSEEKIDSEQLKNRISNQTDVEWQNIQNNVKIIEEQLKDSCGFNVKLSLKRNGSGKIEIDFADADDLLEIVKLFQ